MSKIYVRFAAYLAAVVVLASSVTLVPAEALGDEVVPASTGTPYYLENDISEFVNNDSLNKHPADGAFSMGGTTFSRGISERFTSRDGIATYSVTGRGFTRLSGTLGRVAGAGAGSLIVRSIDGTLLGGYHLPAGTTTMEINMHIPSSVHQVHIRLQSASGTRLGFGDAYFIACSEPAPPLVPPRSAGDFFLQSEIQAATTNDSVLFYPAEGAFTMLGVERNFFRGLSEMRTNWNGVVTYSITGRGFTRLSGTIGRAQGTGEGLLTVHTVGGRLLGGYVLPRGMNSREIDMFIPSDVHQIHIRLQSESGTRLAFGDAYFIACTNPAPMPEPPNIEGAVYLESNIPAAEESGIYSYPAEGAFTLEVTGRNFFRGITEQRTNWYGVATYSVAGRDFTRLSGTLGRVQGAGVGLLTIHSVGGRLLGGYVLQQGIPEKEINVYIPSDVEQVHIRMQSASGTRLAFGDAHFINCPDSAPPMQPPHIPGAVYLGNDIAPLTSGSMLLYPAVGAFTFMVTNQNFFRGIAQQHTNRDATVTYDISGRGFTRLSGTLGRVQGTGAGTLTVTDGVDGGTVFGTVSLAFGGAPTAPVSIDIPANANQIQLRMQSGSGTRLALGDAYFTTGQIPPSPTPPAPPTPTPTPTAPAPSPTPTPGTTPTPTPTTTPAPSPTPPIDTNILTFTAATAQSSPGTDILVPISISGNNYILNTATVTVTFDESRLEWQNLGAYAPGNAATHPWIHGGFIPFVAAPGTIGSNSATFSFMDINGNAAPGGTLLTLRLRVRDNAPEGSANVTLTFTAVGDSRGQLTAEQFNGVSGAVLVRDFVPGDINSDGRVDIFDSLRLARHLAGWPGYASVTMAADTNGDGRIDIFDALRLSRHLAGWPGYENLG